jgi:hypothetical protein
LRILSILKKLVLIMTTSLLRKAIERSAIWCKRVAEVPATLLPNSLSQMVFMPDEKSTSGVVASFWYIPM